VDFPYEPEPDSPHRFDVRRSDLDTYGHVHNLNYLSWGLEALPEELSESRYLASMRGHYRREVTLGSAISAAFVPVDDDGRCAHGVFAHSGSERYLAAAAETRWLPRAASRVRAA